MGVGWGHNTVYTDKERTRPEISANQGEVFNQGLRSLEPSEEIKKIKEKYSRPKTCWKPTSSKSCSPYLAYFFNKSLGSGCSPAENNGSFYPWHGSHYSDSLTSDKTHERNKGSSYLKQIRYLTFDSVQF